MNKINQFLEPEDDLDAHLEKFVGEENFIKKMRRKKGERPKLDDMSFEAEVTKNWWMYFLLLVSAAFTGTLGIYMGLAPYKVENGITFQTDGLHVVLALVYCVAFIVVTEFAFGLGKWLYFTREEDNLSQKISMIIWMVVAGISILLTGIAGGSVIASNISFLTSFVEVSVQSQEWVVKAIPGLFFFYAGLGTVYILSSDEAAAKRTVREQKRMNDLAHETRQQIATQWGELQVQKATIRRYIKLVEAGAMTAGEAQAALAAGETLGDTEHRLGRDLDGNGQIGNGRPRSTQNPNLRLRPMPEMALDVDVPFSNDGPDPHHPTR